MRAVLVCILSCFNILIFGFIGLNYPAFQTVIAYKTLSVSGIQETPSLPSSPSFPSSPSKKTLSLPPKTISSDWSGTLSIPTIHLDVPVRHEEQLTLSRATALLEQGAMSLTPFTPPNRSGSTIIFGHSSDYSWNNNAYGDVFALLTELQPGDQITLTQGNNKHHYEVSESLITSPSLEGIATEPDSNQLVLSTCYPIGFFNKRFNVIATPIQSIIDGQKSETED